MTKHIFRTKSISEFISETKQDGRMNRDLGTFGLTMLGIGAIVGTGIFVLTGVAAANYSGPALIISFIIAALACGCAALCYAEFAAMVPVAGSAYTYGYVALGEFWAWVIGWDLILEYASAVSAVDIGWSGYFNNILTNLGLVLPKALTLAPYDGGIVNLPARPSSSSLISASMPFPQQLKKSRIRRKICPAALSYRSSSVRSCTSPYRPSSPAWFRTSNSRRQQLRLPLPARPSAITGVLRLSPSAPSAA